MTGKVYLVGSGPGDPGLITVKGLDCIKQAQVVVYDRLANNRILSLVPQNAEIVFAGKRVGHNAKHQEEINQILIDQARMGKIVVRLKGGDPFVFGRGGEEALALQKEGISFEVIPGVTSAIAGPAYAGIPLTHRLFSSSFTVVTGTEDEAKEVSSTNWKNIAATGGTLVILMGWRNFPKIVNSLIKGGMDSLTPAAAVQWGSEPHQRTVTGNLKNIVQKSQEANLAAPVVIVIGEVVKLRSKLRWFDNRPLFGKQILVTRSRSQASSLINLLLREGANPIELPTLQIVPPKDYNELDKAILNLNKYDWVVFTSVNAVDAFFCRMKNLGKDTRSFSQLKVCAIGSITAQALDNRGILPDFIPEKYMTSTISGELQRRGLANCKVLLPRSDIAPDNFSADLQAVDTILDQVLAYRTAIPKKSNQRTLELLRSGKIDIVTFASSSTVRNLLEMLEGDISLLDQSLVACIGPVTTETAREFGLTVDIVAKEHTVSGLVRSLVKYYDDVKADDL